MDPKNKAEDDKEKSLNPNQEARLEAEEGIANDPDFIEDTASADLDEGELANLDNSSDNDI